MFNWLIDLFEYFKNVHEFVLPHICDRYSLLSWLNISSKYLVHMYVIGFLCFIVFASIKGIRAIIRGDEPGPWSLRKAWADSNFWYRDPKYYVHLFITIGSGWLLLLVLNWAWFRLFTR